jgi:hypothetical protein
MVLCFLIHVTQEVVDCGFAPCVSGVELRVGFEL